MVDKVICGFDSRGEKQIDVIVAALKNLNLNPLLLIVRGLTMLTQRLNASRRLRKTIRPTRFVWYAARAWA